MGEDNHVVLAQDTDGSAETAMRQTFRSIPGLGKEGGISFESVYSPGKYLTATTDGLMLTDGSEKDNTTFSVAVK